MNNIFVFTQNLKLDSLKGYVTLTAEQDLNIFVTTHFLFENERAYISSIYNNPIFLDFADFLADEEMAKCDTDAYSSDSVAYETYLKNIKRLKNRLVIKKLLQKYPGCRRYILSDDLGIDIAEWKKNGFKQIRGNYYYYEDKGMVKSVRHRLAQNTFLRKVYHGLKGINNNFYSPIEVSVGYYQGKKYVFIGKMSRIDYRLDISFEPSEEECRKLNAGEYEPKENCTYMTTWHEHAKCNVPDDERYCVRWAQDGYLPPNYTHYDYSFKPDNVVYYCWDQLGTLLFKNKNLPYELIPFRKRLYLPEPIFPQRITNVLIVASGSGDWTALKNRSDDDIMVDAFAQIAKRFPDIHFTYRCHPTWILPENVGVNSINRVSDYFASLGLNNITLSSNIPMAKEGKKFHFSFSRSSLDEDLKNTDFVFGEHSISMIDAAFKGIAFCSVNITKRRNFFCGINDLGFPICKTVDEIVHMIKKITEYDFQRDYLVAVKNYNEMTDK